MKHKYRVYITRDIEGNYPIEEELGADNLTEVIGIIYDISPQGGKYYYRYLNYPTYTMIDFGSHAKFIKVVPGIMDELH